MEDEGVKYELTFTGTILEGDLDGILESAKNMYESVFDNEIFCVVASIRIDDREDEDLEIEGKKESWRRSLENKNFSFQFMQFSKSLKA